jgi:hypothetical protein
MSKSPFVPPERKFITDDLEPLDPDCLSEGAIVFDAELRLGQHCDIEDCPVKVRKDRATGTLQPVGTCALIDEGFDPDFFAGEESEALFSDVSLDQLNPDEM